MNSILLIEPDSRLSELYKGSLLADQPDLHVEIATSAQDALFAIDSTRPQLILLELDLPAHSGFEFLYEFASYDDWQQIPIIILSRLPQQYYARMALTWQDLGVVAYLYKAETSLQTLQGQVRDHLGVIVST